MYMERIQYEIIVWSLAHGFLYLSAIFLTPRPLITTFHLFLVTQLMGFTFRPIFAALTGAIGFYYVPNVEEFYVEGLVVQFWFALFYVLGYLAGVVVFNRKSGSHSKNRERSLPERDGFSVMLFSLFLGLASVVAMHVLSAGRWLAHARSEAITAAVPLGRVKSYV